MVFGATGRAGREIVTALLAAGHDVVAVRFGWGCVVVVGVVCVYSGGWGGSR